MSSPTETPAAPILEHRIMTATQGMFLILNAASLRRLPLPFHATATGYEDAVSLQFATRAEVVTWAAALGAPEVADTVTGDGVSDRTVACATWLDVPLRLVASIPREPR